MGLTVLEPWLCAYHHHSKTLGLLAALHFFSLHYRDYTMGFTVLEPWLCLSLSQQKAGPFVFLAILAFQARYYGNHQITYK